MKVLEIFFRKFVHAQSNIAGNYVMVSIAKN